MRVVVLQRAHRQLQRLYEISTLMTRFQSVDETLPKVIAVVSQTLSVASAIFIGRAEARRRLLVWQPRGRGRKRSHAAKVQALDTYTYLVGRPFEGHRGGVSPQRLPSRAARSRQAPEDQVGGAFVCLPLVVGHGEIFGALQIETGDHFDERDLIFLNAIANQLAIAIDRQAMIRLNQVRAETREREQRLLAGVNAALNTAFDHRQSLAALAQFAVGFLADICIIDELSETGAFQRLEVRFAREDQRRELADRVKAFSPQPGWKTPQAEVAASGRAILWSTVSDPLAQGIAHDPAHAAVMRAAGLTSMMAVPLAARGKTIGVLTLCATNEARNFSSDDLRLVQEIARHGAIAIDNARLYEQALRSSLARDNLLAVVSHDLRNPLAVIRLALSGIAAPPEAEDRRKSRKHLGAIRRATDWMSRLIEDLLEAAKIEGGTLAVGVGRIEPGALIAEAVESLHPLAVDKGQSLVCEISGPLAEVCADKARIDQVLANLIGNAIKFTPPGGKIVVRAERWGDAIRFAVADSGVGISANDIPHLFDRFWQAERTAHLGTGLGLFIAKSVIEAHHGRLWVESSEGSGARFLFTLPLASARPASAAAPSEVSIAPGA